MDKEYILLNEIDKNENITQRELSKKTELSLGSVNILLNKMIHEGLIKMKQIPMNRVAYMLTPVGIAEKVRKTGNYIKVHYKYINETTSKIKNIFLRLIEQNGNVCVLIEHDEISELIKLAIAEIDNHKHIEIVEDIENLIKAVKYDEINFMDHKYKIIVVQSTEAYNDVAVSQIYPINLLELL